MTAFLDVAISGVFHAAVLFLVAAGLQLVFGVQKIVNLACGSFYALGAYFGIAATGWAIRMGLPQPLFLLALILAGASLAVIGAPIERLLRTIYDRDEAFQLLLTFALVLMIQDAIRFVWGPTPLQLGNLYMVYGRVAIAEVAFPAYNLLVIAASLAIAVAIAWFLRGTNTGRLLRATAEDRETAQALGVDVGRMYALVFMLGTALGTIGGALVAPSSAASLDMAVETIVEAFAVVVIGGLGSMPGAVAGALIVGLMRAGAVAIYPEAEILAIYLVVVLVLVLRPAGLFGRATA